MDSDFVCRICHETKDSTKKIKNANLCVDCSLQRVKNYMKTVPVEKLKEGNSRRVRKWYENMDPEKKQEYMKKGCERMKKWREKKKLLLLENNDLVKAF